MFVSTEWQSIVRSYRRGEDVPCAVIVGGEWIVLIDLFRFEDIGVDQGNGVCVREIVSHEHSQARLMMIICLVTSAHRKYLDDIVSIDKWKRSRSGYDCIACQSALSHPTNWNGSRQIPDGAIWTGSTDLFWVLCKSAPQCRFLPCDHCDGKTKTSEHATLTTELVVSTDVS